MNNSWSSILEIIFIVANKIIREAKCIIVSQSSQASSIDLKSETSPKTTLRFLCPLKCSIQPQLLFKLYRKDFRILAHRIFKKAKDLDEIILPINFDETREGIAKNIETRKKAISYLINGGCVGIGC